MATPEQIDLGRFELLSTQARATADVATRAERLQDALDLWRGPALADVAFEPFAALELPRLNDLRLNAQHDLVDAELALGRHVEVLPDLESFVAEHFFDERLRSRLALALYRAGRQAAALDVCREARRALVEELGLDPTDELRILEQQILRHDPMLAPPAAQSFDGGPARRTVTVLSADLASRDEAFDEVDPERLRVMLDKYGAAVHTAVERHGGVVQEFGASGEATAVFGLRTAREDDALRAVRAAVEVRSELVDLDGAAFPRIGLSTGEVHVSVDPHGTIVGTGTPFRMARRLAGSAGPDEILLAGPTLRLVRAAVATEHAVISSAPDLATFRLVELVPGAPAFERRLDAPLVGRERERAELRSVFDAVARERRCRIATILGEAGIGKTRLVSELATELGAEATVAVGRCVSYGEGATYLPLAEMIAAAGGDLDQLLVAAATTGEQFLAVRRFLESLARERPLVLVLDDAHWAEPTLLDLFDYLGDRLGGAVVLVVRVARPELLEARPSSPVSLRLSPLSTSETESLLTRISPDVEPALQARIVELAEGNPLYAEQLLAYALEGDSLSSLPPTLDALIAGRLDRLTSAEQAVLQQAAVVGRAFRRSDLERLGPTGADSLDRSLEALVTTGLLRRGSAGELRFDHVLVRDAAYAATPKGRRADLHESFAAGLAGGPDDSDELVGYHLEHAVRYHTELGVVDAHTRRLAADAGTRLGAAGIRAWKRHDTPAAVNLLERAASLLDADDPVRLELLCELGVALRSTGQIRLAEAFLVEAAGVAAAVGEMRAAHRAQLELANVRLLSSPGGRAEELLAVARDAIPVFRAAGDDRSLSRAWRLSAYVEGAMRCRYAESSVSATRALRHSRRSGWSTAACLGDLAAALYYGPTPVPAALARCCALLRDADLAGEANVRVYLAGLEAMRGRFDAARADVERAQTLFAELGQTALAHAAGGSVRGEIELLAGDPAAAEEAFRESYDALEEAGDRAYLATRAVQLAEAVHLLGRGEDAMRLSGIAEDGAPADDVPTQFLWRAIQARVLAGSGDAVRAEVLAREAVRLAETTDALSQRAKVVLDLAEVLCALGLPMDAAEAGAAALALFEEKGNTVGADRAQALLVEVAAV